MKVLKTEPDMYKQEHPIESDELIEAKLKELELELEKLSVPIKASYLQAVEKSPKLVSRKEKLQFLRCEVFNADLAAARMAAYWDKRLEIFGPEKAFMPLTLDGALRDDMVALELGLIRIVPEKSDPGGRLCLFFDPSRQDKTKYSTFSMTRAMWYVIHQALEDETSQKKGLIMVGYAGTVQFSQVDRNLQQHIIGSLRGCIPMRMSAMHMCHPPSFFRLVFPIIKVFMGERLRKRMNLHSGSNEHVLSRLEDKFGLSRDKLPSELGGGIELDHMTWLEQRRKLEGVSS